MEDNNINNTSEGDTSKIQAEEYLNNWKRERADFINYKKDEQKRMSEFIKFANETMALEVIAIIDDLELAVIHNSDTEGLDQILIKFQDLLKKYRIEKINTDGPFDPLFHEAVEGKGVNISEVIRAGYLLYGKVIRPARVKIVE